MVPKTFFGHMIQGSIVNRDGTTTRPITIPIGTLRMWDTGAVWYYIGDREPYNWDGFEGFIALGQRLGAELLYTFGRAPVSQRIPGTMVPTNQNWQRFVWMVVERASGRVKCWEMWNEPAVASMYWAGGTIAQLLAQSRSGYRIIKSLETDAIVLTPSFNELGSYGGAFAANYLTQMRSLGAPSADAVAFHSYAHTPEGVIAELNILRSLMARQRISLPIWCTEVATLPLDRTLSLLAAAGVERVVWNAQIPTAEDYVATKGLGVTWQKVYNQLRTR